MSEPIALAARLDLPAASKIVEAANAADLSQEIVFDASDVTHLGAMCAQALIAISRAAQEAGGAIKLENVSDRVTTQLATMGLSPEQIMEGAQ